MRGQSLKQAVKNMADVAAISVERLWDFKKGIFHVGCVSLLFVEVVQQNTSYCESLSPVDSVLAHTHPFWTHVSLFHNTGQEL